MSIKQMSKVWEKAATDDPSMLLVMLALADWANDDGVCWPAIDSIAEKCRISARTTQRIIRELESSGLLEVTRHRGRTHTNTYKLMVPTCQVLFDVKGVNVAPIKTEKVTNEAEKVTNQALKGDIAMSPEPSEPPNTEPPKERVCKFSLPDWMEPYQKNWKAFLEMRKKIGASPTDHAKELLIKKLKSYCANGYLPDEVLDRSTEHSWRGIFEPKGIANGNGSTRKTAAGEKLTRNREAIVLGLTGQGDSAPTGHREPDIQRRGADGGTGVVLEGSPQRAKSATNS